MYDFGSSAQQNLFNRRDRFRATIRKQKLNSIFRERRKANFAREPDPCLDKWEEDRLEQSRNIQLLAEALNADISAEWLKLLEQLATIRKQTADQQYASWIELRIVDNLLRGVTCHESTEEIRSLAALILSNVVCHYRSNSTQVQERLKSILIEYHLARFLIEHFRQLLQSTEKLDWNRCLENLVYLTSNLIYDSDIFRNEFIQQGIVNTVITIYLKANTDQQHRLVAWLISNLTQQSCHQESQEPPPSPTLLNGFTPILMNYINNSKEELVAEALASFTGLVRNQDGNIQELYYVNGLIERLIELVASKVSAQSMQSMDILVIMANHEDCIYADKMIEKGLIKSMEEAIVRVNGESISTVAFRYIFMMIKVLVEHSSVAIDSVIISVVWENLIQICAARVSNDLMNQAEAQVAMETVSIVVAKLTFPQAESMLRRVRLIDVVILLMQRFQDSSITVLFQGLQTIELTLMIVEKYQRKIHLDLKRNGGFQRLLETMNGHPNFEVASLARSITEIFDVRVSDDEDFSANA